MVQKAYVLALHLDGMEKDAARKVDIIIDEISRIQEQMSRELGLVNKIPDQTLCIQTQQQPLGLAGPEMMDHRSRQLLAASEAEKEHGTSRRPEEGTHLSTIEKEEDDLNDLSIVPAASPSSQHHSPLSPTSSSSSTSPKSWQNPSYLNFFNQPVGESKLKQPRVIQLQRESESRPVSPEMNDRSSKKAVGEVSPRRMLSPVKEEDEKFIYLPSSPSSNLTSPSLIPRFLKLPSLPSSPASDRLFPSLTPKLWRFPSLPSHPPSDPPSPSLIPKFRPVIGPMEVGTKSFKHQLE